MQGKIEKKQNNKQNGKNILRNLLLLLLLAGGTAKGFADEVWGNVVGMNSEIRSGTTIEQYLLDINGDIIPDYLLEIHPMDFAVPILNSLINEGGQVLFDDRAQYRNPRIVAPALLEIVLPDGRIVKIVDLTKNKGNFPYAFEWESRQRGN
jgi:hypothetical protein